MPETSLFMKDMTGVFNTPLTASEEALFVAWAVYNNRMRDLYNYDLRGAWKELNSGSMSADTRGHLVFIVGFSFAKLDQRTKSLLRIQQGLMEDYLAVLNMRLERLEAIEDLNEG